MTSDAESRFKEELDGYANRGRQRPVRSNRVGSDRAEIGQISRVETMLAMELIPAIRARLAELDGEEPTALTSGRRAALWRAQQHAARLDHTVDDLRRYCLASLTPRRFLDEADENDYLRGFRHGFQEVLREIRRIETRGSRV